jgi:biotin synthase
MLTKRDILNWLREDDPRRLEALWQLADRTRKQHVGDQVHLRGLIEISNCCRRRCVYCGLRAENIQVTRYRMTVDEILQCARQAVTLGYGTVVLQSGEDEGLTREWVAGLVRRIKAETTLAVTLSLGERSESELTAWRSAGADRYLLRFETSNPKLYDRIHPALAGAATAVGTGENPRIAILRSLHRLGYEIGSGVMVGIPGQSREDLVEDIEWFHRLGLDMIGVGPFLPHPATPMGRGEFDPLPGTRRVPNTEEMTCKVVALARLACPDANIPATTALATVDPASGREAGLTRGANIVMPNLTPHPYRAYYEIYPGKACVGETADVCAFCLRKRVEAIGRTVGSGRGDSPGFRRRGG